MWEEKWETNLVCTYCLYQLLPPDRKKKKKKKSGGNTKNHVCLVYISCIERLNWGISVTISCLCVSCKVVLSSWSASMQMRKQLWRKRRDSWRTTRAPSARDELPPSCCRRRASRRMARRTRTARSKRLLHNLRLTFDVVQTVWAVLRFSSSSGFMWRRISSPLQ